MLFPWSVHFGWKVSLLSVYTFLTEEVMEEVMEEGTELTSDPSRDHCRLMSYPKQVKFSPQVRETLWDSWISDGSWM